MAELIITNQGNFTAQYGDEDVEFLTNLVSTRIVTGITATKEADKEIWINGPLVYTINVYNDSGEDLTDVYLTDVIDSTRATFDDTAGVKVNGVPHVYSYYSDILHLTVDSIPNQSGVVIEFQVLRV